MISKNDLFGTVADLVDLLRNYGVDFEIIRNTLRYHGFTEAQIKEWYGIYFEEEQTNVK